MFFRRMILFSRHQDVKISRYQDVKMSIFQDIKISRYQYFKIQDLKTEEKNCLDQMTAHTHFCTFLHFTTLYQNTQFLGLAAEVLALG